MRMRPLALVLACLAGLGAAAGLTACSSGDPADAAVTIQMQDTSRTIETSVGDEFTVEVASNPTTGYTWSYRVEPAAAVREVSSEYVPDEPQLTGSGGTQIWRFRAQEAPSARIEFAQTPPGQTRPEREVAVEVAISR